MGLASAGSSLQNPNHDWLRRNGAWNQIANERQDKRNALPWQTKLYALLIIADLRDIYRPDEMARTWVCAQKRRVWDHRETKRMTSAWTRRAAMLALIVVLNVALSPQAGAEPPTPEVAKRCLHFAYIAYPWKRPGATPMSSDREAWFRDCLAKKGEVPQPEGPAKPRPPGSTPSAIPAKKADGGGATETSR
jgi:hypothetical protein